MGYHLNLETLLLVCCQDAALCAQAVALPLFCTSGVGFGGVRERWGDARLSLYVTVHVRI